MLSKMSIMKRKLKADLILINGIAVIAYVFLFLQLDLRSGTELMLVTSDSKTYMAVADWMSGGVAGYEVCIRPVLYPLFMLTASLFGGYSAIWIIQAVFWLLTVNISFYVIKMMCRSTFLATIGGLTVALNFSLMSLTFFGLTEILATFLLSILVLLVVRNKNRYNEIRFAHLALGLLTLLTLTRPVFSIPLYTFLVVVILIYHGKKYIRKPVLVLIPILILLPAFIQMTIVQSHCGKFTISTVGELAFKNYLFAQGLEKTENVSREESQKLADSYSKKERDQIFSSNKSLYSGLFIKNVLTNITEYPAMLYYREGKSKLTIIRRFMKTYNKVTIWVHLFSGILMTLLLIVFIKERKYDELIQSGSLALLLIYLLVTTGISFSQGDRLVISTLVIWVSLYLFVIQQLLDRLKGQPRTR